MSDFGFTQGEIDEVEAHVLDCARTYCPSRTGTARGLLEMEGRELHGPHYLVYVCKGTAPHPIDPRHPKEALYWPMAAHPYAHVNHPGTRANDFRIEAARDAAQRSRPVARQAGRRIVGELKASLGL